MSYWPLALVRLIDRRMFADSARDHGLIGDVCQQIWLGGALPDGPDKLRRVGKAIRDVLTAHGLRRQKHSRRWSVPPVDVVAYAVANEATTPRRAWHSASDRRRSWAPEEVAVMNAARGNVGYGRGAAILGRSRDQVIAWYRRSEGRKTR